MKSKGVFRREYNAVINYYNIFWLFFFGSIIGFIFEGVWQIIQKGHWENHSATILGPFCIIYGIAAIALYIASKFIAKRNAFIIYFIFAAIGSVLEFFASLFQELLFNSTSWNYEKHFLNLGGRISLKMTILWGLLGLLYVRLFHPLFCKLFGVMKGRIWNGMCILLSVFMAFNLTVTCFAVMRWSERVIEGTPPSNRIERFFDENYDNEKMINMFSNMKFSGENAEQLALPQAQTESA